MNKTPLKACVWSGVFSLVLFGTGMLIAGVIPPPSPSLTASEVAQLFQDKTLSIQVGFILIMLSGIFIFPFICVVAAFLRQMESKTFPIFANMQLVAGSCNAMLFILPAVFYLVIAFRPERPEEITHLLYDFGWFVFLLPFPPLVGQALAVAGAIFNDTSGKHYFPRWVAYMNLWVAIGSFPALTLVFFKSGPFAWNGLFPFWIPGCVFFGWFFAMAIIMYKAIDRIDCEE